MTDTPQKNAKRHHWGRLALPQWRRFLRPVSAGFLGLVLLLLASVAAFEWFDHHYPPPMAKLEDLSHEIVDRDGLLLRAFRSQSGQWRLKADLDAIDQEFVSLLLAYEDKRFWQHGGIDPLAVARASWQFVSNGRIISGASTISMQLARLLEPREKRSLWAKARQMARALQLERRLSKREILESYLTLAPYGGNLEGVRSASLAYFAKEPGELTLAEAALLVALPQSPEWRRPDLRPTAARKARNNVLTRVAKAGIIAQTEVARASDRTLDAKRRSLPRLAAHATERLRRDHPDKRYQTLTLSRDIQARMEEVARDHARRFDGRVSLALVLADARTGHILAEIGSPDYVDEQRAGWVDMSRALRSPGSALKPFIYGLAFEEGLVRPATLIRDKPVNFSGYRPKNFDMDYQGEVSIRDALLMSLNVPAVALLDAVGPARLMARMKNAGLKTSLPEGGDPGLAIGLGGLGISLVDLTQLYTAFSNGGRVRTLSDRPLEAGARNLGERLLDDEAVWHVSDILRDARPPEGAQRLPIAYKTGTSYGYRDAWSVGFDGRYVLAVWVGRPDNSSVPGITGRKAAAPILFEAFAKTGLDPVSLPSPPFGVARQERRSLPKTLQQFEIASERFSDPNLPEPSPSITYPPDGAQIELGRTATGRNLPLMLKIQDGRPPFRWLANGETFAASGVKRRISWQPDGAGQATLTVIDAVGRASSVSVFLR